MDNINNLDFSNKYVQGSIWKWNNLAYRGEGVQSGSRPVIIISNNMFNYHSESVNCVSITSVLKESPVHVPIYIQMDSHVQCEQIHTISKTNLIEFLGMAPPSVVSGVKAKLRIQFDIGADKNMEMLNSIKKSLDTLDEKTDVLKSVNESVRDNTELIYTNSKEVREATDALTKNISEFKENADKGFGLHDIENDILKLLVNLYDSLKEFKTQFAVEKANIQVVQAPPAGDELPDAIPPAALVQQKQPGEIDNNVQIKSAAETRKERGKRHNFTYEDRIYISDDNTPIESIMEKYGYERQAAQKIRFNLRGKLGITAKKPGDKQQVQQTLGENDLSDNILASGQSVQPVQSTAKDKIKQPDKNIDNSKIQSDVKTRKKPIPQRYYSYEDKMYIADKANSIEEVMEKFGYDKKTAYKMRYYFQKQLKNNDVPKPNLMGNSDKHNLSNSQQVQQVQPAKIPETDSPRKSHRNYTDEEKKFILDKSNSADALVKRFGFKDRFAAYAARKYIKRNLKR